MKIVLLRHDLQRSVYNETRIRGKKENQIHLFIRV